jgi:hypothetical protein
MSRSIINQKEANHKQDILNELLRNEQESLLQLAGESFILRLNYNKFLERGLFLTTSEINVATYGGARNRWLNFRTQAYV